MKNFRPLYEILDEKIVIQIYIPVKGQHPDLEENCPDPQQW
jgi:hypothetical protein